VLPLSISSIFSFFLVVFFYLLRISRFSVEVGISFDHTERHTTVGRTPLDEGSARRRGLYLTTTHKHSPETNIHAPGGIRTHDPSKRAAEDPLLISLGSVNKQGAEKRNQI
jgi:hypothetical protein